MNILITALQTCSEIPIPNLGIFNRVEGMGMQSGFVKKI